MKKPEIAPGHSPRKISLALSWDGTRCPIGSLPKKARDFLGAKSGFRLPRNLARLFVTDKVQEIRVCWVPQLKGGATITESFPTPAGRRIPFQATRTLAFGNILGVVYRRLE